MLPNPCYLIHNSRPPTVKCKSVVRRNTVPSSRSRRVRFAPHANRCYTHPCPKRAVLLLPIVLSAIPLPNKSRRRARGSSSTRTPLCANASALCRSPKCARRVAFTRSFADAPTRRSMTVFFSNRVPLPDSRQPSVLIAGMTRVLSSQHVFSFCSALVSFSWISVSLDLRRFLTSSATIARMHSRRYESLCDDIENQPASFSHPIAQDIRRTFPDHVFFAGPTNGCVITASASV